MMPPPKDRSSLHRSRSGGRSVLSFEVDEESLRRLRLALKAVGETDAPAFTDAMQDVGRRLVSNVRSHAPNGALAGATKYDGLNRGHGLSIRALGMVDDPRAKSFEFGRTRFYHRFQRGGKGSQKRGVPFKSYPGMRPRPFVGIKDGGEAIGQTAPYARTRILQGIAETWESLGAP